MIDRRSRLLLDKSLIVITGGEVSCLPLSVAFPKGRNVTPLNRPKWNTILDERKGKADEQEQAQRCADYRGAEAGGKLVERPKTWLGKPDTRLSRWDLALEFGGVRTVAASARAAVAPLSGSINRTPAHLPDLRRCPGPPRVGITGVF